MNERSTPTRSPLPATPRPGWKRAAAAALLIVAGLCGGCASTSPESDAAFKTGLQQAESGNVDAAIETLSDGARRYPGHLRMRFELARLQYETGEALHLGERKAMRDAAVFSERGKREEALAHRRKGNELRARATPLYQSAAQHLRVVVDDDDDDRRVAWASFLLTRIDVFFEDWEAANEDLTRAIALGKPTGPLLSQWREFQAGIREKIGGESREDW